MMPIILLHLSDIHISKTSDPILAKSEEVAATVYKYLPECSHLFIVISGDIAFSGKAEQYILATDFLIKIQAAIRSQTTIPVSFILAPGNHDCDFDSDNVARRMLLDAMSATDASEPDIDQSVVDTCACLQESFFAFRDLLEQGQSSSDDLLWRTNYFTVEGKLIAFETLNIAWMSKKREESGFIYFPISRYAEKAHEAVDLRILVMHHPLNWFSNSVYRNFRKFARQISDVIISGHEHINNAGVITEIESNESAFIEGGILQSEANLGDCSFNIAAIDLSEGKFLVDAYKFDGKMFLLKEEGSWSQYHSLPNRKSNSFRISESFHVTLDDPGAFLKHPGRTNITLADIFIYPDLRKIVNGELRRRQFVSATNMLSPDFIARGLLIEGEEKSGRSSLLYQLYLHYHAKGYVPLLLKGKWFKKHGDVDIETVIKKAFSSQYDKAQIEEFYQLPLQKKILFLDDFDDCLIKSSESRARLLGSLRKRFGYLVVTVGEMFEMREMLEGDTTRELSLLEHFKLQSFGYSRREQLIRRWFSLGTERALDEAALIERCDEAERLMDSIMTKTIIPSVPLYLLALLQSMEAGRSGDFKESSLGYYYQYLLIEAFQNCGVKPDKLTEVFQYSAHLAWEYHSKGKREMSIIELSSFNEHFSKDWHTVDFTSRIDLLLKARVLCRAGEDYAFRYPYIYYYLKGKYLSEQLSDSNMRDYIDHCCKHLYVRDHANTILFLAHHTTDDFVLNSIAEAMRGLFSHCMPLTFNGDTGEINKLIEDAPKLIYSGDSPRAHREKSNDLRDEMDDGGDGLADSEESSDQLSLLAQLTMLFKTIEILGQVLKNQYSKIQRRRKTALLEELFNGPLRALRDFYDFIEKNPDALIVDIESAIKRKGHVDNEEERKKIARKVVASFIQILTCAFLMKAAQGARSDSLAEDVSEVVENNKTIAFKLIELCIYLDSPKALPRSMLRDLFKDASKDLVTTRVIQIMVLNRLYMFKTTEQDMQWLSSELQLDLEVQHSIAYFENKRRLIK